MKHLILCPSLQAYNRYPDGTTEMANCVALCSAVAELARGVPDLDVTSIVGAPDDGKDPLLRALVAQLDRAATHLRVLQVDPADAAILSVHTDSGETSHVANCYGGEIGGPSWQLGEAMVEGILPVMQPSRILRFDYSYYMFYRRRAGYVAALLEAGSHQNTHDVTIIQQRDQLAEGMLAGALGYFGLAMPVEPAPADVDARGYFSAFGVVCNPDTAIYKFWLDAYRGGDASNMGPALAAEESGAAYGLPDEDRVQKFANAVVHASAGEGWKCRRAMVVMEAERWLLKR